MKKYFLLLLFLLALSNDSWAQILNIDDTQILNDNPYEVKVYFTSSKILKKEDIQLTYGNQKLNFDFQSKSENLSNNSRAFCILVETTGFTHFEPIKNFKNAIHQILAWLNEQDKVALCSFSEANLNQGTSLKILSKEFTEDKNNIKKLTSQLVTKIDTNAKSDIYKSIYEALDWMAEQKDLPQQKYLIVFSAGINHSLSSINREDCENKSIKLDIPIYSVIHKTWTAYSGDNFKLLSDNTHGRFKFVSKDKEISEFLSAALNLQKQESVLAYHYELVFFPDKVQSGLNSFEIQAADEKIQGEFIIEKKMNTQFETILFITAGLGIILIGVGLFMKAKKKDEDTTKTPSFIPETPTISKINPTSNTSEIKSNLMNTVVNTSIIPDIQRTAIASANIPTLKIVSMGGIQNFPIQKLPLLIGRDPSNHIIIQDNSVSKTHAKLYFDNGYFYLEDLDSTNGLVVNGQKISKVQLKENEKVYLGNATIELYLA